VLKALAKDRDARYATALELFEDLQQYVYSHGVFAGTSSLRRYIHDAFPDSAPPAMGMPPFAPSAPSPKPTNAPPPPEERAPDPLTGSRPAVNPPPSEASQRVEPLYAPETSEPAMDADDLVYEVSESLETERPPDLDGVVASAPHPELSTERFDTQRPPESSQVQESTAEQRFPSEPPGVFDDADPPPQPFDAGPDTNPAPAPDPHPRIDESGWDDTTEFEPMGVPMTTTIDSETDTADEWAGDATQVVDPRTAESK